MILSIAQVLDLRQRVGGLDRFHRKVASGVVFGITKPVMPKSVKIGRRKLMRLRQAIANANNALEAQNASQSSL